MVRLGREAIGIEEGKAVVLEVICSGCGICVRKCPFKALSVVNLPDELEEEHIHRFGPNAFTLFRLPVPRKGRVIGLLGRNGMGKTTALRILSGELRPNLGRYDAPPEEGEILRHFAGTPLHGYLRELYEGGIRAIYKPQYIDRIPKFVSGSVDEVLNRLDEGGRLRELSKALDMGHLLDREIGTLSGGELQRVAIAATLCREADVYLLDEPSSHLDVYQRLRAARVIRGAAARGAMVLVAEHDLAVLDYLSDDIYILYGEPAVYGIFSHIHGVRGGINIYIEGYIPDENIRFRNSPISFHIKPPTPPQRAKPMMRWTKLKGSRDGFEVSVEAGEIGEGEVIGILGKNGTGKTTFLEMLAGINEPDEGAIQRGMEVSYKPQYPSKEFEGTVEEMLKRASGESYGEEWFQVEVIDRLNVRRLLDKPLEELSGGELQRATIAECLGKPADLYLLDEPSAYLDVEERLSMARAIRRITKMRGVTAFVVEHDIYAQDFIADRLIIFTGEPTIRGRGSSPLTMEKGMNFFLRDVGVTFRRDPETDRPRVNKEGSKLDREQRRIGRYYYA